MIRFFFIILGLVSAMTFAHADSVNDTSGLNNFINDFDSAWNTRNSKMISSLWIEDGDWITPTGQWIIGQNQIENHFLQEGKGSIRQSIDAKRFLTADLVFVDTTIRMAGMLDKNGKEMTNLLHGVYLLGKVNQKWKILSLRILQFHQD